MMTTTKKQPVNRTTSWLCWLLMGVVLLLAPLLVGNVKAQGPVVQSPETQRPFVSEPITPHIMNKDLRTLPTLKPWRRGEPTREVPIFAGLTPAPEEQEQGDTNGNGQMRDPVLQPQDLKVASMQLLSPNLNFDGISFTGARPPDTIGDVGRNYYIQMVNSSFAIYDKAGARLVDPTNINSLWFGFGGECEAQNNGDPVVLYDPLADRWLISQFANISFGPPYFQCIAISQTPDPVTGGWFLYDFSLPQLNDYPKFGVWPDAYYMGVNNGFFGSGSDAYAFDRGRMLAGLPATFIMFDDPGLFMLPSDLDGSTPPPAGSPNYFIRHVDGEEYGGVDRLEIFEFHVDFNVPANSTFTGPINLPTAAFDSILCSFGLIIPCIPQPQGGDLLSSISGWLMWRLQYRNFGSYEALVVNHTVDAGDFADHAGIRWYELRRTGADVWSIFQQGTYAPDAEHRWMGSVAMDKDGNMALGYSVSSANVFPSIRYTGRLASDPVGTIPQGEFELVAGGGSQSGSARWGDYSSLNIDPVDDCTFWYTQEYIFPNGNWQTRIGAFKFESCGKTKLYLPLIFNEFISAPDLVVDCIGGTSLSLPSSLGSGAPCPPPASPIEVTIRNQGPAAVIDPFWVDFCFDPNPIPTGVNQICDDGRSIYHIIWGVTEAALPLASGDTLVLTINEDNPYFQSSLSNLPTSQLTNTVIYAQVDSANVNTTYGGVLEIHEINGEPYNNIINTVPLIFNPITPMASSNSERQLVLPGDLPPRPQP